MGKAGNLPENKLNTHRGGRQPDLMGQVFGSLTVVRPTDERKNGYTVYECECHCGHPGCKHIVYRSSRSLKNSKAPDCGCEKKRGFGYQDLTGRRFGMLTVLSEEKASDKYRGQVHWNCLCDCGNTVVVTSCSLTSGNRISCGCQRRKYTELPWVGKRFGKLTVLKHESFDGNNHYWRCHCDCGKETIVAQKNLSSGKTKSCGCLVNVDNRTFVDGTCIEAISGVAGERKAFKNSKSGIRGVYQNQIGKWCANIGFKGRTIYLGSFDTIEEAREARIKAEEIYFDATVKAWKGSREESQTE